LFDELTRHAVSLPDNARDFTRLIEQAYRARKNRSLDFEATLVHELWRLMVRDVHRTHELDAESAYVLRLKALADSASAPLYAIGLRRLAPAEVRFLETYAQRASLICYEAGTHPVGGVQAALAAAWPLQEAHAPALRVRAQSLRESAPLSVLGGRVSIFGAPDTESEARAVDVQVRDWLLAGYQRIAVITLDRVTARRARALLERAGVLVRDESGWPMATTSAATVLSRWLDVVSEDAWHRDLLDLMKSPFAFHDWPRDERQQTVWRLERYVRKASVLSGISNYLDLATQHDDAEVRQLLARVQRAMQLMPRVHRPLARWLEALLESLHVIGVIDGWRDDSAGVQVIEFINKLKIDLAHDRLAVPFAEWRRWLLRQLESASFVESTVVSPVVFTHLAATPLRAFDAALVLGCDSRHLSAMNGAPVFFNEGVRAQLGLPTRGDDVRDTEALLAQLIASTPRVVLTWQTHAGTEENLLAPPIERLRALHRAAYDSDLVETRLVALLGQTMLRCDDTSAVVPIASVPAPVADRMLVPDRISASAYNTLMACPYKFHARHLLRLVELDDVEELLDKSGYGMNVHNILTIFHKTHPQVSDLDEGEAVAVLKAVSEAVFAGALGRNALARGWLLRWQSLIPAYLEWQRAREAQGWRWLAGEAGREQLIRTPAGREFKLVGRLDRVDESDEGATSVIDYKMRTRDALHAALEMPGEDVQLPVYALLWDHAVMQALYLSMDRDEVADVPVPGDPAALRQLAQKTRVRLAHLVDAMYAGQEMRAQGAPRACEYCEMHGLCRRGHWP
jgi:ATP-dependent helicase/nuclease subunit B